MTKKKFISKKKDISQAGMARINLSYYTLSSIRKYINALLDNIKEVHLVCDILGQSLLFQLGLDDEDILAFHKEHLTNIDKATKQEGFMKDISIEVLKSLPFQYNDEKDELVLSKELDGKLKDVLKKKTEGFT